jgi:hypothetical protein
MLLGIHRGVNRSYVDDVPFAGVIEPLVGKGQPPRTTSRIPITVIDFIPLVSAIRRRSFGLG